MLHSFEIISITKDIPENVSELLKNTDWVNDKISIPEFREKSRSIVAQLLEGKEPQFHT